MKELNIAMLVKESKSDTKKMEKLIMRFTPLINTYARKLFFLDEDDAKQELRLAIIEAVRTMSLCDNEGACVIYLVNAVKYRYSYLCKRNIKKEAYEGTYCDVEIEMLQGKDDVFEMVETLCDYSSIISRFSKKKKNIIYLVMEEYSDVQIAKVMNVSRQYVHKVRRELAMLLRKHKSK